MDEVRFLDDDLRTVEVQSVIASFPENYQEKNSLMI